MLICAFALPADKVKKTQAEMAQVPGIKQPTVAGMEKPGRDVKLSTLRRCADVIGGKLNIDVELPDGTRYIFRV